MEDIIRVPNGDITRTDRFEIRIINNKGSRTCGRTLEHTDEKCAGSDSLKLILMGTPRVEVNKPVTQWVGKREQRYLVYNQMAECHMALIHVIMPPMVE